MLRQLFLRTAIGLILFGGAAAAQSPEHLRGNVDLLFGDVLAMTTKTGEKLSVSLDDTTRVLAAAKVTLGDVKPGSNVGITSLPQPDGSLRAIGVVIFPPTQPVKPATMPWDLAPSSRMTNGTVGTVTGTGNRTLTVNEGKAQQTIAVPANVPIVALGPGTRDMLAPEVPIVVFARKEKDNTLTAGAVVIGKDGVTPPM
jgi:hypothetical protein